MRVSLETGQRLMASAMNTDSLRRQRTQNFQGSMNFKIWSFLDVLRKTGPLQHMLLEHDSRDDGKIV